MLSAAALILVAGLAGEATREMAEPEVAIESTRVDPPVVHAETEQRVTFVNRTGHMVHVDFIGDAKEHHVFQVAGSIWAVFHRPGRHPYVVHIETPGELRLQGVVEVTAGPAGGDLPTCSSITVMTICLQP